MQDLKNYQITRNEAVELLYSLSPIHYIKSIGFKPFEWQVKLLKSEHKRKTINGCRQSGKSKIISSKPSHKAKYKPKSLSIIIAPTEQQAYLDMEKVKEYIAHDPNYPEIKRNSDRLIELNNGSLIIVVPATEKAARGYSKPDLIILDEASRIDDIVYMSGIIPMLTDNSDCELINISTPNGKAGFFFDSMNNPRWERYIIKSPWDVIDLEYRLKEAEPEEEFRKKCAEVGIFGYYSPRHKDKDEQEFNLGEMGPLMYRQEYCVEFVEPEDQVFGYDEIERMMNNQIEPLDFGIGEAESLTT